jgi:hypothetical protein
MVNNPLPAAAGRRYHHRPQGDPRSAQPRTHGLNRATASFGNFLIRQAADFPKKEYLAIPLRKLLQRFTEIKSQALRFLCGGFLRGDCLGTPLTVTVPIDEQVAGYAEDPPSLMSDGPAILERADHPDKNILNKILRDVQPPGHV